MLIKDDNLLRSLASKLPQKIQDWYLLILQKYFIFSSRHIGGKLLDL